MKTFKQLINEVQEPLSQGEQNFKGLHNPINRKNIVPGVTDQDHVFNGTPRKEDPKSASYENFRDDDESAEAYDKNLQVKPTAPEKDVDVKEEADLEEGKYNWDKEHRRGVNDTMGNRMLNKRSVTPSRKPPADVVKQQDDALKKYYKEKGVKEEAIEEKHLTPAEMKKREEIVKSLKKKGMEKSKAYAIATATAKKVAEESEQIDELSKKTLGSYVNKAASSAAKSSYQIMKDKPENAAKHGMDSFKRLEGIKKATAKMAEEAEQIDEISKKTAYAAYADRANDDYSKDYGDKLHGMITKKWGKKAGDDAEAHASAQHFGRGGKSSGTDKLSGIWNTAASSMRTTKSGKINKQDTKAKGNEIKSRLGSHTKAKLPEELELEEAYKDPDAHYAKLSQERKDAVNRQLRNGKSYWEAVRVVMKLHKEETELEEARRGRPRKDGTKPAGDEEGGREHIIVQLRKVVNLRGQKHVEFNDNSKHEVGVEHAKKALSMHDNLKRAEDKQNLANQLAKSHSAFKDALSGKMEAPKKKGVSLAGMKNEAVTRNSQDINPEQGEADSTTMRSDRGAIKTYTTVGADGRMKLVKHREHAKEVKIGESVEMNSKNAKKMIKHDCAKHVLHKEWGEGETVEGMHTIVETTEGHGYVTHYDVMFEHGIVQNVPVEDLQIITMVEHMHDNKKSKMEGKEHTVPKTSKEKDLAALAEPKDKITHKDVLVGRGVIKKAVKEALSVNMQSDSIKKLKKDPAAGENLKADLPPTQGNKPVGGESEPSRVGGKYSMEEEKLMKLYDSLSEENKAMFESLIETDEGFNKLLTFAEELGL